MRAPKGNWGFFKITILYSWNIYPLHLWKWKCLSFGGLFRPTSNTEIASPFTDVSHQLTSFQNGPKSIRKKGFNERITSSIPHLPCEWVPSNLQSILTWHPIQSQFCWASGSIEMHAMLAHCWYIAHPSLHQDARSEQVELSTFFGLE